MIAVERTHELGRDHDWFPAEARRAGRLVAAAAWTTAAAASVGTAMVIPIAEVVAIALSGWALGAAVTGERAHRALARRALAKMARGEVHLAAVEQREEGELVVVSGTVTADEALTGVLEGGRGVYRRMTFVAMRKTWIHEAAVDFALLDADGNRILIEGGGARWLVPSRTLGAYPSVHLDHGGMPPPVRDLIRLNRTALVAASEDVLAIGAKVQIVGYKTASADATGEVVGYRHAPQRATLRSGPALPLVITSAA